MTPWAFFFVAVSFTVLICIMEWVNRRFGDMTLACLVRDHKTCYQHLTCPCPHHDAIIHEEMQRVDHG